MENKVGFILASHGSFCSGAKNSVEMIIGKCDNLETVSVIPSIGIDDVKALMKEAYIKLNKTCDDVLVFTDLLCGTPNNIAVELMMKEDNISIVTGYNLAVLVEVINARNNNDASMEQLLKNIKQIHEGSICVMNKEGKM